MAATAQCSSDTTQSQLRLPPHTQHNSVPHLYAPTCMHGASTTTTCTIPIARVRATAAAALRFHFILQQKGATGLPAPSDRHRSAMPDPRCPTQAAPAGWGRKTQERSLVERQCGARMRSATSASTPSACMRRTTLQQRRALWSPGPPLYAQTKTRTPRPSHVCRAAVHNYQHRG